MPERLYLALVVIMTFKIVVSSISNQTYQSSQNIPLPNLNANPQDVETLAGKTLLMLGCRKTDAILMAADVGIKLIIASSKRCNASLYDVITDYVHFDMTNHTRDRENSRAIISFLRERNHSVDGCCTFEDDLSVLSAIIGEEMNLVSPEVDGILSAKIKSHLYIKMMSSENPFVNATPYAVPAYRVENEVQLRYYLRFMKFPVVLKLEHGTGSAGVSVVDSREICIGAYTNLRRQCDAHKEQGGSGLGFGDTFVLMEYVGGSEHSVDIIMFKGELVATFIKDKLTTPGSRFLESVSIMPSGLGIEDQEKVTLAAYTTCRKIGLNSGVFNLDIKIDHGVPKIIEVNGRMGGVYLREWIYHLYKIDIALALYQVSLGVRPRFGVMGSCGVIAGTMLRNSSHQGLLDSEDFSKHIKEMNDKGLLIFKMMRNVTNCGRGDFEKPRANLATFGATRKEAVLSLMRLSRNYSINDSYYTLHQHSL